MPQRARALAGPLRLIKGKASRAALDGTAHTQRRHETEAQSTDRQKHQQSEHRPGAVAEHPEQSREDAVHRQILKFTMRNMMKLPSSIQAPATASASLVISSFQTLA